MKILFWFSFILIIMVYLGYPLFLFLLTIFKKNPAKKGEINPFITLIIPAHNEEKVIDDKLRNTLALNYQKNRLEIIVISDCSSDKTDEIVKQYVTQNVKLIIQNERKGKMAALNRVVPNAKGEIIVFSDANTMFDKYALKNLVRNFNDEKVGCVAGNSRYAFRDGLSVQLGGVSYTAYERILWNLESQLQSLLVVHGGIYALRKSLFSPVDEAFADDFVNPLRVAAQGYGVVYEPEAKAVENVAKESKEEFNRKVRVISQGYIAFVHMLKVILSCDFIRIIQYIVHKFLRWLVPLFLITLLISNLFLLGSRFYSSFFALQIIFYLFAILGYWLQEKKSKIKIFYIPFYFCLINMASLFGLFVAINGKQTGIWEKAETTR